MEAPRSAVFSLARYDSDNSLYGTTQNALATEESLYDTLDEMHELQKMGGNTAQNE